MCTCIPRLVALVTLAALIAPTAGAEWSHDPSTNNTICTEDGEQRMVRQTTDETGGAVLLWEDDRNGFFQIYAQRVDRGGELVWDPAGVQVCTYASVQTDGRLASDGEGGAFIVWTDSTSQRNIYGQHLSSDGSALWPAAGAAVCTFPGDQEGALLVTDGEGGLIAAWTDGRDGAETDIYAQRLGADGQRQWGTGGTAICTAAGDQQLEGIISDSAGGAILVWVDARDAHADWTCAQRVDAAGNVLWTTDGVILHTSTYDQRHPQILPYGDGGARFVFELDYGSHPPWLIFQRLDADGNRVTPLVFLPGTSGPMRDPRIAPGSDGTTFVVWTDGSTSTETLLAQLLGPMGTPLWGYEALTICPPAHNNADQWKARVVADGVGGAVVAWEDGRFVGPGNPGIVAQRLDALGRRVWPEEGALVTYPRDDNPYPTLLRNEPGSFLVAWHGDNEQGGGNDIFAQRIDANGYLGEPAPAIASVVDFPNDQGLQVVVSWDASYLDGWPWVAVTSYTLWARDLSGGQRGPGSSRPAAKLRAVPERLSLPGERLRALTESGWIYVDEVPAVLSPDYAAVAFTFGDSTGSGIPWAGYKVIAHTETPALFWESAPDSGYSVDNVAPGAPTDLIGEPVGGDAVSLAWTASGHHDEDLAHYAVYRGEESGFPLSPEHLVGTTIETSHIDASGAGQWFYRVTAVDIHGNEGEGSNEVEVRVGSSAVEQPGAIPTRFALHPLTPNPVHDRVQIRFDLPAPARVRLEICGVDGRRVATLADGPWPAGRHVVAWAARSAQGQAVPYGVYFARLTAGSDRQTQRVLLTR